jgi:peptide/nickel transport system substrate-binding protein
MDWPTLVTRAPRKTRWTNGGWNLFITGWGIADNMNPMFFSAAHGQRREGLVRLGHRRQAGAAQVAFLATADERQRKEHRHGHPAARVDTGIYARYW